MKFMSVSFSLAMILGLALVVPSTLLIAQQSNVGTEGGTQEIVFGLFRCNGPNPDRPVNFGRGFVDIEFHGTSGITSGFFGSSSRLAPDSPFEICEAITLEVAASARSLGCTVGENTFEEAFNTLDGYFSFVCHGRRNQVMNAMAGLAKQMLNIDKFVP